MKTPTTVYTDVYGKNPSGSTPFTGSIKQYFSGSNPSGSYLRGATRDWRTSTVHAPNRSSRPNGAATARCAAARWRRLT